MQLGLRHRLGNMQGAAANRFVGPLDGFDTSAFTLSTAVLYSSQLGQPMFRIRRSSDDNHCDVLPDTSELINGTYFVGLNSPVQNFETASSATTLGEFVASSGYSNPDSLASASDAFVRTAYDPSGNASNATQATAASQPQIVSAGSLVTGGIDFNGTTSAMATPSIDLTGTDNLAIFSVLTKDVDDTRGMTWEFSPDVNMNNGSFYLIAPANSNIEAHVASKGTTIYHRLINNSEIQAANSPFLIDVEQSISDPLINFRANGTQFLNDTATQGTGNYGNHQLFIGARDQSSAFFDGKFNALILYPSKQANRAAIEAKLAEIYGITLA